MNKDTEDQPKQYLLGTSPEELSRLDSQHWFTKKCAYDGKVIVDESVKLGKDAKVLDAGTGTGVWIIDLAQSEGKKLESAALIGIDMSTEKFSPKAPRNVELKKQGVLDLPKEWDATFDFVHQRLLIAGLKAEDWPKVLEGYLRILKPGGHIQLCEVWPALLEKNGPASANIAAKYKQLSDKGGLMSDCAGRLGEMLKAAGFVDVKAEEKRGGIGKAHGDDGLQAAQTVSGAYRAQAKRFVGAKLAENEEQFLRMVKAMEDEWDGEKECYSTYVVATAMKPL